MILSGRAIRLLFEALDRERISTAELLRPFGLDRARLVDESDPFTWSMLVTFLARLDEMLDHDPVRLQAVGRSMTYAPSYASLQWVARRAFSLRAFYQAAERWVLPTNFPHLRFFQKFLPNGRLLVYETIPEAHAPSEPFFHISTGAILEVPVLMGLPRATIVEQQTSPRVLDLVVALPVRRSRFRQAARALATRVSTLGRTDVLEEQRRALAAGLASVQHARDELREVLERVPDPVVIHVEGVIVFANAALVDILGYGHSDDLVGKPLAMIVDPRSLDLMRKRMARPPSPPEDTQLTEAWIRAKDGTPILVEISPTQRVVFDGKAARLLVARNITERVRLQEQLAAADRLASVGLLAAGVAHEVNNPLAYVLNNIEIARKQLATPGAAAEPAREALMIALEGVDRIRFIVRELLLLARGDDDAAGRTDVRAVVESTLALARVEIARTATLVTELEPVPPVRGSVPRIAQVVLNLVLNAIEAMKEGDSASNQLLVRLGRAPDGRARLEIEDSGVGVSPDDTRRIFEPFYTTKPPGQGTGLGLAITQRLVLELGGELSLSSTVGRGSTFRVLLPPADEER